MQRMELVEGQREVSVHFPAPAFVELSILRFDSGPCVRRLEAGVLEQDRGTRHSPHAEDHDLMRKDTRPVSPEGTARLGPLAPGEYHLVLAVGPEEGGSFRREVASMAVSLWSGDNAISIPMPLLTDLTVKFPEGSRGQTLSLRKAGEEWVRFPGMPERVDLDRALDAEGRATFPCVPPGEYVLEDREGSMMVRVPAAGEVLFEPRRYDAVRIVL